MWTACWRPWPRSSRAPETRRCAGRESHGSETETRPRSHPPRSRGCAPAEPLLLGDEVRYDGQHTSATSSWWTCWAPTWSGRPSAPGGDRALPIPASLRLVGNPASPRLVAPRSGADHTERMRTWAAGRLDELAGLDLVGFVFRRTRRAPASSGSRWPAGGAPPSRQRHLRRSLHRALPKPAGGRGGAAPRLASLARELRGADFRRGAVAATAAGQPASGGAGRLPRRDQADAAGPQPGALHRARPPGGWCRPDAMAGVGGALLQPAHGRPEGAGHAAQARQRLSSP